MAKDGLTCEFDVSVPTWSRWIATALFVSAGWLIRLARWIGVVSLRIRRAK